MLSSIRRIYYIALFAYTGIHGRLGPVRFSYPGLFRLVLAYFFSHGTIKSAEISRLLNQPNSPLACVHVV